MKAINIIIKLIVALAAIAGAVYVAATYGDKIVAWCKKVVNCKCFCACDCDCECDCQCEDEACCCEEVAAPEAPAEEAPVAAEVDFEG